MAYKTPGVYVEEIATLAPSVVAVETAIPAFIGYTEKATDAAGNNLRLVPTRIKSLLEFQASFGGDFVPASYQVVLDTTTDAVGEVTPLNAANAERRYRLYNSVRHYYANGGGPCYIVSVGSYSDAPALGNSTTGLQGGLARVAPVDDPTLLVFPDAVSLIPAEMGSLQVAALAQCELLQDRFVIMDLVQGDQPISLTLNPIQNFRDNVGTNSLKYGAAYYPWLRTIYEPDVHFRQLNLVTPAPALAAISNTIIDGLTGDSALDALPGAVRTADATVVNVVSAVNVGAMTAPGAITLTRANFTQLSDHFAGLVDRLRQLPAAAPDADVRQRFSNLLVLPRALALGLRTLDTQAVSSIALSTSTATVTTASAHGFTTGQSVTIAGANQTEYNGTFTITVTGASTFTYTVTGTPATPATGTIAVQVAQSVTSITRAAGIATVTTASAHGFTTGQSVTIAGANQTAYNGTFTITVTGATTFTYTVAGTPATPATGTITAEAAQSVSSITRSASPATVTTVSAHGFTTGQSVTIAGANPTEYNGTFTITVTGATTFTYTVTGTPATPATGTITAQAAQSVTSITRAAGIATVTTASAHGFTTGQSVTIAGANQTAYNGTFTITVTGATTFTYTVPGTPATPATGTITAQTLPLPPTLSLAVTQLRQDTQLAQTVSDLVAYEKHADVMSAVSATRVLADVVTAYASLNATAWIAPNANVTAIGVSGDTFTAATLRETALNAASALRRLFDPLAAAVLSLFSSAEFLADEAENQLFDRHPVFAAIASQVSRTMVLLPPSGAVAGVYAAVDRTRGVWKAPANVSLADVSGVAVKVNDQRQEDLNVSTTGKSVNAIRVFAGKGCLVWGARTLAGNDNEWRYVPVRRFFNMAEESIKKATEPFVFEPNDRGTWVRVRAMIENFLTIQWRQGALAGGVPAQAFYVKVGLGETMTSQDILEGRMIIEIGMAVVRPAEFIILRFAHKMQTS
jgi:phage tail sheath protein FI